MKALIIGLWGLFTSFGVMAQQGEKKTQKSRLLDIVEMYKLGKEDKAKFDSICNPTLSLLEMKEGITKKLSIKDSLLINSVVIPMGGQIVRDSMGLYTEVTDWRIITGVASEAHGKGDIKEYENNVKLWRAKMVMRLREEADRIEKGN
jgi:hypothetical protein